MSVDRPYGPQVHPSWEQLFTDNPEKDFLDGCYRGVFVELGPGKTPVSHGIAQDPDILVIGVDHVRPSWNEIDNISECFGGKRPRNFKYLIRYLNESAGLELPILGMCSFFPPVDNVNNARGVFRLLFKYWKANYHFPIAIFTESGGFGGVRGYAGALELEAKKHGVTVERKFVTWKNYAKKYPATDYSKRLSMGEVGGTKPAGVWKIEINRTSWDLLNWIVPYS